MDVAQYESIKTYVGFGEDSAQMLRAFHAVASPHFEGITADFYDTLERHPAARGAIVGGREQVERLKRTLVAWMHSVLLGPHDEAYLAQHARIGRVHVQIGLPQEFMLTAMNRIREQFLAHSQRAHAGSATLQAKSSRAINQVLDLELAIMLDSYRDDLLMLRLTKERQEVAEAVPVFVLALDDNGRIQLWNRALEEATGFPRTEMLGKPGKELVSDAGDRKLPIKSGGHRIARWRAAPGSGGLTYAMGVDVTSEVEMQRRTLRAERLAAVGTLAAGLAHEVRNPLNSATLQLQVLKRRVERGGRDVGTLMPVCEVVLDEIRRLDHLVTDFLAFARPRPLELRPVDPNEVVNSVLTLVRAEAESAGIELQLEQSVGLGVVPAESERLRQVLLNLMRNAIEAMGGHGTLRITTRDPDAEGFVQIEVHDTGPGFPEDAPVFDAFYTTKAAGTGLGLAIVHSIVTDHGGTISVTSEPGNTCFTIRLPTQAG
ncbi:MAG: protoglobin domain-containing protein [Polyangiaceae bacterium]|nr:protoglobin domain-containing protein [Polyangiaceae bacterium]